MANKIPISQFMEQTAKKKHQVHYLFRIHKKLKCKVVGEKECRVNMDEWEKILKAS